MDKLPKKRSEKSGLSPGSYIYTGKETDQIVKLSAFNYNISKYTEKLDLKIEEALGSIAEGSTSWINICGLHDISLIERIGQKLNIHPLMLEDILNTYQRPKIEFFDDYIVIILRMISFEEKSNDIDSEQISILIGKNYVITFQEREGDVFDPLRSRIRNGKGIIRKKGSEYLSYSLLDSIIDNYFIILEKIGESIEILEDDLMAYPSESTLKEIYKLKREILFLRKYIWPLRELIRKIERFDTFIFGKDTKRYVSDIYDHTVQIIDTTETYRDMVSGMLELYLSSVSHKMNEIMKILTIIATIFIPLTFIAGVYGMNFEYMPELKWPFGYFGILGLMLLTGLIMILFFKRRKWL